MTNKNYVLTKEAAQEKMHRMALEIAENLSEESASIVLIGIRQSGMVIAEKISVHLLKYVHVFVQIISASFDKHLPVDVVLSDQIDFRDKNIIIIDDVTNTGRTLMYALKPLLDTHPRRVQTLVLVERMHKLFPIKPDYVGLSVATTLQDHILVQVENGEVIGAYVE